MKVSIFTRLLFIQKSEVWLPKLNKNFNNEKQVLYKKNLLLLKISR